MDFMTILTYVLAIIETGALIGGLTCVTKAIRERKDSVTRKSQFSRGFIYIFVYLVLNVVRNFYF